MSQNNQEPEEGHSAAKENSDDVILSSDTDKSVHADGGDASVYVAPSIRDGIKYSDEPSPFQQGKNDPVDDNQENDGSGVSSNTEQVSINRNQQAPDRTTSVTPEEQVTQDSNAKTLTTEEGDFVKGNSELYQDATRRGNDRNAMEPNPFQEGGVPAPKNSKKRLNSESKKKPEENIDQESDPRSRYISFFWSVMIVPMVALASYFLFDLIIKTSTLLVMISSSPSYVKYPFMVVTGLLLLAMLVSLSWVIIRWLRFKPSAQLDVHKIYNSSRTPDYSKAKESKQVMTDYFESFISEEAELRAAKRLGQQQADKLKKIRTDVRKSLKKSFGSTRSWLEEAERRTTSIDNVAEIIVIRRAMSIGVKTAIIPYGVFDAMVVFINFLEMSHDLMVIYNIRPTKMATLTILLNSLFDLLYAGYADEKFEHIAEAMTEHIAEMTGISLMKAAGTASKGAVARAAEGTTNGIFAYRLGMMTIKRLRPIKAR